MPNDRVSLGLLGRKGKNYAKNRSSLPVCRNYVKNVVVLCALLALFCCFKSDAVGQANYVIDANTFINGVTLSGATTSGHVGYIAVQDQNNIGLLDPAGVPPYNRRIRLLTGSGSLTAGIEVGSSGTAIGSSGTARYGSAYEFRTRPGTGGGGQPPAVEEWRINPNLSWSRTTGPGDPSPDHYAWTPTSATEPGYIGGPNLGGAGRIYPDPYESSHWTPGGTLPGRPDYWDPLGYGVNLTAQGGGPTMARHGSRTTISFLGYDAEEDSGGVIFNAGTYSIIGAQGSVITFGRPTLEWNAAERRWQYWYPGGLGTTAPTLANSSALVRSRIYFADNQAASGGAIDNAGHLTLIRVTLNENRATGGITTGAPGFGGAISNVRGATLLLDDVSFGGAIPTAGAYTIPTSPTNPSTGVTSVDVQVAPPAITPFSDRGNIADYGGALYNLGIVEGNANAQNYVNFLSGTTAQHYPGIIFVNNEARVSGGAIFNDEGGIIRASAYTTTLPGGDVTGRTAVGHTHGLFMGTFNNNRAMVSGGAIFNDRNGLVSIRGSFTDNYVTGNITTGGTDVGLGGAIYNVAGGVVTLDGVLLQGNVAGGTLATGIGSLTGLGGAIHSLGTLNLGRVGATDTETVTFTNNRARDGGAIYSLGAINSNTFVYFTRNDAGRDGGALYNMGRDVTLNNATFMMNTAGNDGGALLNLLGELTLETIAFSGNQADRYGGAISNSWGTVFLGLTSRNASFTDNASRQHGGAIFNDHGTIELGGGSFTRNTSGDDGSGTTPASVGHGGAIFNQAGIIRTTAGTTGVTFTNNRALGTTSDGGAIYNARDGEIEIQNSTFTQSQAGRDGGAIFNKENATITLQDTIFTQSSAVAGSGGAIFNEFSGTVIITRDTAARNEFNNSTAHVSGGAIYNDGRINAPGGTVSLSDVGFYFNTAVTGDGGAVFNGLNSVLSINDPNDPYYSSPTADFINMFADNAALSVSRTPAGIGGRGGAIFNDGDGVNPWNNIGEMSLYNVRFLRNQARTGGALYNLGRLLIDNSGLPENAGATFANNSAIENTTGTVFGGDGGAVYNDVFGVLTLHGGSFLRNDATNQGGAIFNAMNAQLNMQAGRAVDSITLTEGSFLSNRADFGGAIYNAGHLTLDGMAGVTTFDLNEAYTDGGAIYNAADAILTLNNVSFLNNRASTGTGITTGRGGAIYNAGTTNAPPPGGRITEGIVNLNVHSVDSVFGLTDDVYFGNPTAAPNNYHLFDVDISAGRTLTMGAGMGGDANANVEIRQTGGGTWILNNAGGNFSGGTAHFEIYNGTLRLSRGVTLDLGDGEFTLYGSGVNYFVGGQQYETTAGNWLTVDQNTGISGTSFTFGAQSVLEFTTRHALANDTYLTLTVPGTGTTTVNVSALREIRIESLVNHLQSGDSVVLIDLTGSGTFNPATTPRLFVDGVPNDTVFQRDESGTLFYGLSYNAANSQLLLGMTASDAPATLWWTGMTGTGATGDRIWNTTSQNWRGTIMNSPIYTFLPGDTVNFANDDGHGNPVGAASTGARRVNVAAATQVVAMHVTGSDYIFDLNGNIRASATPTDLIPNPVPGAGNIIEFGSARVNVGQANQGRRITAHTITFGTGSTLNFDTQGAANGQTFLTLDTNSGTPINLDNTNIRLTVIPTGLTSGHIVLVDAVDDTLLRTLLTTPLDSHFYVGESTTTYAPNRGATRYELQLLNNRQLVLAAIAAQSGQGTLFWTGAINGTWDVGVTQNWRGTEGSQTFTSTIFLNNDIVTFDNTAAADRRRVSVAAPVQVDTMTVSDSSYVFDLTVGSDPAITATGAVNLGNATLNINAYNPDDDITDPNHSYTAARHVQTLIQAGAAGLTGFNPLVTVNNQVGTQPDFLSASAWQDGNTIKVETRLSWNSTAPDRKAHGDFTVASGEFTLGVALGNNTGNVPGGTTHNRRDNWDGTTLTKLGAGRLILTGANQYTGRTMVSEGALEIVGSGSVAGGATVNNALLDVHSGGTVNGAVGIEYRGAVNVGGGGRINGNVVMNGADAQLYGTGEILGQVTISNGTLSGGTIGAGADGVGTLHINNGTGNALTMQGGRWHVDIVSPSNLDLINMIGSAAFSGSIHIELAWDDANVPSLTDQRYRIATATGGITGVESTGWSYTYGGLVLDRLRGNVYVEGNNLWLEFINEPATIYWTGAETSIWRSSSVPVAGLWNWRDSAAPPGNPTYFTNGDTVIFDNEPTTTNRRVEVDSAGVQVGGMTVSGTGYVFELLVGANPAIRSTGAVDLGGATLDIRGYTPDQSSPYNQDNQPKNVQTIIRGGSILNFDPNNVTVMGQTTVDYLRANAYQDGNEIKVETRLSWYSEDYSSDENGVRHGRAHGTFTIDSGSFVLGANLANNTTGNWSQTGDPMGEWLGNSLLKQGAGTLILTGTNTYTGGTTVSGGWLQIGDGGTTGSIRDVNGVGTGAITNNANVRFNRSDNYVYSGVISGTGAVTQAGAGMLTLTGDNTYTGGTTVDAGRALRIGEGGTAGSIRGDVNLVSGTSTLIFHRSENHSYNGGTISGLGTVQIASGTFRVGTDAWINTAVEVMSNATLAGTGRISGPITLAPGGTLAPGNSAGIFRIDGDITFEQGSIFEYDIVGNDHDLVVVENGGVVTIDPGAALWIELSGAIPGRLYQVISVETLSQFANWGATEPAPFGHLGGPFGHVFNSVFFEEEDAPDNGFADISSAGYWLKWKEFAEIIGDSDGKTNAGRAAKGVDEIVDAELLDGEIYFALMSLPADRLLYAFQQLHGEVFATNRETALRTQRRFQNLLPTGQDFVVRPTETAGPRPKLWNRWGTVVGDLTARSNIGTYSGYDLYSAGFAAGMDRSIIPNMMLGVAVGYDNASTSFDLIRSKSKTDALRSMVYVSWFNGSFFIDSYGGYTKNWHQTTRNINIGDGDIDIFTATAKGKYDDDLISTGIDFGRVLWLNPVMTVAPGIGLHYARLIAPAITETGGGYTNLHVAGGHYQSFQASLGAKASRIFTLSDNVVLTPEVRGYYVREFADDEAIVRTSFADPSVRHITFNAHSGKWGPDSGRLGMGLGVLVSDWMTFRLDFDREIYNHADVDVFSTTLGVTW